MEKQNNKKLKYFLSVAFLVVVTCITFGVLLKETDIDEMMDLLASVDVKCIVLGAVFAVLYLFFEGMSMKVIVNSLSKEDNEHVSTWNAFSYGCIDSFYSLITPFGSGGQPFTIYYMLHDGIKGHKVSMATLMTLLEYKLVLVVYQILIAVINPKFIFGNGIWVIMLYIFSLLVNVIMVLLIVVSMFDDKLVKRISGYCFKALAKIKIIRKETLDARIQKFEAQIDEYKGGAVYIKNHPAIFLKAFLYNFARISALFLITYAVYLSFGLPADRIADVVLAQAIIYIMVDTLPLPGGVGITETLFLTVYSTIFTSAMITPAVLLTRLLNYIWEMLVSGLMAFYKQIKIVRGTKNNA